MKKHLARFLVAYRDPDFDGRASAAFALIVLTAYSYHFGHPAPGVVVGAIYYYAVVPLVEGMVDQVNREIDRRAARKTGVRKGEEASDESGDGTPPTV